MRRNIPANASVQLELSRLLAVQGAFDAAVAAARAALSLEPSSPAGREQLASLFVDLGDAASLEPIVQLMQRVDPDGPETLYHAAALHFLHQEYAEAAALGERAATRDPNDARTHNLLGASYGSLGRMELARRSFRASVRANPRDAVTYVNLGFLELQTANWNAAVGYFAEALTLDASSTAALTGLADALERQGETERAESLRRDLRLNPTELR